MNKLNSSWVAGFIDGDGSFGLDKVKNTFYRPSLSIAQNDPQLLYKIKDFFECGSVTKKSDKAWHYRCRSAEHFKNFIIPKLGETPFQTIKQYQYNIICQEVIPLLTDDFSSKKCNRQALLEDCDQRIRKSRNDTYENLKTPINLDWFFGFFEAEGNFYLGFNENYPRIAYKVTQKDLKLLNKIQDFFGFGLIQSEGREGDIWKYNVEGIQKVTEHGLPLFMNYPLKGKKNYERVKFLRAVRILKEDGHKTEQGLIKLRKLSDEIRELRNR